MNTDEKIMLGVGVAAVTALAAVAIYETSKPAAAAPAASPVAPGTSWIEVTGKTVTMPVGATVAMSYMAPNASILSELQEFATVPATEATGVQVYPVGTAAPAGFPDDGAGTNAFRVVMTLAVATASFSNAQALRTWYHT